MESNTEREKILLDYRPRRLVGLGGKATVGKSPIARELIGAVDWEYTFADPLKAMARALERKFKIRPDMESDKTRVIPELGCDTRTVWQTLGDWAESIRPNMLIHLLAKRLNEDRPDSFVISDVRKPSEVDFVHDNGGVCIRLVGETKDAGGIDGHSTENAGGLEFDYELDIDSGFWHVVDRIKLILNEREVLTHG